MVRMAPAWDRSGGSRRPRSLFRELGGCMADRAMTQVDGMRLDLFAPGMTLLHKAGLAGLWMTLNGFEERRTQLKAGSWKLADRSIELHWTDRAAFFESLFAN